MYNCTTLPGEYLELCIRKVLLSSVYMVQTKVPSNQLLRLKDPAKLTNQSPLLAQQPTNELSKLILQEISDNRSKVHLAREALSCKAADFSRA